MKRTIFTTAILLISIFNVFSSIVITGKLVNAKSRLVTLDYFGSPSMHSPNFFGAKQLSTFLNVRDEFKFVIKIQKGYCVYRLGRFEILVKDKDSINIYVDFNDIDNSFIAKGRGCGLTNFWFAVEKFKPRRRPKVNNEEIIEYWEKKRQIYSRVLNAFKTGSLSKYDSISKEEININRLTKGSKLTPFEYNLAQNRINYSCISAAISCCPFEFLTKNTNQFLELFKSIDLSKNTIIDDHITENLADKFVWVKCLKNELAKNDTVLEEKFYKYYLDNFYYVAKEILPGNLIQKLVANNLYSILLDGEYERFRVKYNQSKTIFTNSIYSKKLNSFYKNHLSALQNKEFNLDSPEKTLNDSTVKELLNSLKGQKVYLILWKIGDGASYALTPFCELSNIDAIQKSAQNIKFIDICLGDTTSKQHWASLIINHQWKGNHYYYAFGDKKEFRRNFNCENKMQFCNAELYYLLDANNNIIKETEGDLIEDIK